MNDDICYIFFEDLYQIKYLQSSTMKILLFILYSLLIGQKRIDPF